MRYPLDIAYPSWYYARCQETLDLALRLPGYAAWRECDPGAQVPILDRLACLPVTTKDELRQHFPGGFVEPGRNVETALARAEIEYVKTSGTTSEQLTNIWYQPWWDASERQSWQWNSHAARLALGEHREALLSSARSVGYLSEAGDLPLARRRQGRFLFLNEKVSPLDWAPRHLERMVAELNEFRPQVLEGNPSFLQRLARHIITRGVRVYRPDLVVLTYELATQTYRRVIQQAFGAPLLSSYGATEAGYVFTECEAGRLHQNLESCHVDFEPLAPEHGGPLCGRILVTTFGNPWRVLVRFDVGDLVRLEPAQGRCPCGRQEGMTIAAVEGRSTALTVTTNGRAITQGMIDGALSHLDEVYEWQVEQAVGGRYDARLVLAPGTGDGVLHRAGEALVRLYGAGSEVDPRAVAALVPAASGKYRLCLSAVPLDCERMLDARYTITRRGS